MTKAARWHQVFVALGDRFPVQVRKDIVVELRDLENVICYYSI